MYQFVLADEYQDTNGVQNDILFMLGDYDEQPNLLWLVMTTRPFTDFRVPISITLPVLSKIQASNCGVGCHYRSRQTILDSAMGLIDHNQEKTYPSDKRANQKTGKLAELLRMIQ